MRRGAPDRRRPAGAVGLAAGGDRRPGLGADRDDRRAEHARRDAGSVPAPSAGVMPNTELRVVDPGSGRDLAEGQPGELVARAPR